jgi:hypothetical protein
MATLGRKSAVRPLKHVPIVLVHRYLSRAHHHFERINPATQPVQLVALFHSSLESTELRLRLQIGPVLSSVLVECGFTPQSFSEHVALNAVVGELIDRIADRGFIRIGDLRDAISRNDLKIDDPTLSEHIIGDELLRADVRLGDELDGVYRRGEVYLRGIQRVTGWAFGTPIGRWLSLFVALPFGGAFMAVAFAEYMVLEVGSILRFVKNLLPEDPTDEALYDMPEAHKPADHGITITPTTLGIVFALGVFFLLLIHLPGFRRQVVALLTGAGHILRKVFIELPAEFWDTPFIRSIRRNRFVRFATRSLAVPAVGMVFVALTLAVLESGPNRITRWSAFTFGLLTIVVNNPLGLRLQAWIIDGIESGWRIVRNDLIQGILSWVVWIFRIAVSWLERCLYAVDEWLRYRPGRDRESLFLKMIVALLWAPLAYIVRFGFLLLIEPQVHPLKHFPVVTVSHKLLLPLTGVIAHAFHISTAMAGTMIAGIPGIFGFIAWEIRENWRLYAVNRPHLLTPVVVGHHGETIRGLLRPGFHSGTLPKMFSRLRRGKNAEDPHHYGHAVLLLAERHLIPYLAHVLGVNPTVSHVYVGIQTIEVAISLPSDNPVTLAFDRIGNEIVTRVVSRGWLSQQSDTRLLAAFAGFCMRASATVPDEFGGREYSWADWQKVWNG